MKPFSGANEDGSDSVRAESTGESTRPGEGDEVIAGDRGIPSINRARSIQSKVSSVLAITLMSTLGLGLLTWYYAKTLTRPAQARHAAQAAVKSKAQAEMTLPPLPPIASPFVRKDTPPPAPAPDASAMERILGPAPALPVTVAPPIGTPAPAGAQTTPLKSPGELAFERRLAGPAFARASKEEDRSAAAVPSAQSRDPAAFAASRARMGDEAPDSSHALNTLLRPTLRRQSRLRCCRRVGFSSPRGRLSIARWRPRSTPRCPA